MDFPVLSSLADVRIGYYIREDAPAGTSYTYLQLKHFDQEGNLIGIPADTIRVDDAQQEKYPLAEGDVLLVGKGARLFAWAYDPQIGPAIASSTFHVIRIKEPHRLLPVYLAILLNSAPYQSMLEKMGEGSSLISIRRQSLDKLPIQLPPLRQQQQLITLQQMHRQEIGLLRALVEKKQQLHQAILQQLMTENA